MKVIEFPPPANANADLAQKQPGEVNHDLIAALAQQLDYAQRGIITAAAWVTLDWLGHLDWAWDALEAEQNDALLAGAVRLEREFEQTTGANYDE